MYKLGAIQRAADSMDSAFSFPNQPGGSGGVPQIPQPVSNSLAQLEADEVEARAVFVAAERSDAAKLWNWGNRGGQLDVLRRLPYGYGEYQQWMYMVSRGFLAGNPRIEIPEKDYHDWQESIQREVQSLTAKWKKYGKKYIPLRDRWESWRFANTVIKLEAPEEFDPKVLNPTKRN